MNIKIRCNLQHILEKQDITLYKLAKDSNVTYPTLLRYKNNKLKSYSVDVLTKICTTLQCDISDLIVLDKGLFERIE